MAGEAAQQWVFGYEAKIAAEWGGVVRGSSPSETTCFPDHVPLLPMNIWLDPVPDRTCANLTNPHTKSLRSASRGHCRCNSQTPT